MFDVILAAIRSSDVFVGGIVLMVMGTALSLGWRLVPAAWRLLLRRASVSMEVRDHEVVNWISDWLEQQPYGGRCGHLRAELLSLEEEGETKCRNVLLFSPGLGTHIFAHATGWLWVTRARDEADGAVRMLPREYYRLHTIGRDAEALKGVVRAAGALHQKRRRGKVAIYCHDRSGGWIRLDLQRARPLDSVVLPAGMSERIAGDIGAFLASRSWHHDMGVPYRRGYLFHGPPGSGKTSFASALAAHFGMDVYLLNLGGSDMNDSRLATELMATRTGSMLLLEDVDAVFVQRDVAAEHRSNVTFSGLLNAIDGVAAREDRVLVMTTNHVERLDPALIRPGRVDVQEFFGTVTGEQAARLFLRFFPGEDGLASKVAEATNERVLSAASLQNVCVRSRTSSRDAVEAIGAAAEFTRQRGPAASVKPNEITAASR